jgi:class 3 adenylate cyclase
MPEVLKSGPENKIDAKLLDEKLGAVEKARAWSPRLVSKLEALLNTDDEYQLFRINPLKFAKERGADESEAIDLFLHAAKQGLFKMEWQLLCPSCGDTVESFGSLSNLHSHYTCQLCNVEGEAQLDNYIEVSFTVSPQVRSIRFHRPESLSLEELLFKYHFREDARLPGGPLFLEAASQLTLAAGFVAPGESKAIPLEVHEGWLAVYDPFTRSILQADVNKEGPEMPLVLPLVEGSAPVRATARPGKLSVELKNQSGKKAAYLAVVKPKGMPHYESLEFDPFLSGNRLLNTQTFRNLFQSETLGATGGIGVRDITLLFTDLKGSTALYERIGDLKAFSMVQQHFEALSKSVQKHHGAIVKTIGDAVMASFERPTDALRASLDMLAEIQAFNKQEGSDELVLKIGMHRGASIVVTLNGRLDYFGQTVNVASRVQGLAEAEEIFITDEVYTYPGVQKLLEGHPIAPQEARLRGIQKTIKVYKVSA